jgi:transcriptional regulator with XRE-family HTH domain
MTKAEANKRAVKAALAARGKTQYWLAVKLDIDRSYLSLLLNGYRNFSPELVEKVRVVLGVDLSAPSEVTR